MQPTHPTLHGNPFAVLAVDDERRERATSRGGREEETSQGLHEGRALTEEYDTTRVVEERKKERVVDSAHEFVSQVVHTKAEAEKANTVVQEQFEEIRRRNKDQSAQLRGVRHLEPIEAKDEPVVVVEKKDENEDASDIVPDVKVEDKGASTVVVEKKDENEDASDIVLEIKVEDKIASAVVVEKKDENEDASDIVPDVKVEDKGASAVVVEKKDANEDASDIVPDVKVEDKGASAIVVEKKDANEDASDIVPDVKVEDKGPSVDVDVDQIEENEEPVATGAKAAETNDKTEKASEEKQPINDPISTAQVKTAAKTTHVKKSSSIFSGVVNRMNAVWKKMMTFIASVPKSLENLFVRIFTPGHNRSTTSHKKKVVIKA